MRIALLPILMLAALFFFVGSAAYDYGVASSLDAQRGRQLDNEMHTWAIDQMMQPIDEDTCSRNPRSCKPRDRKPIGSLLK